LQLRAADLGRNNPSDDKACLAQILTFWGRTLDQTLRPELVSTLKRAVLADPRRIVGGCI